MRTRRATAAIITRQKKETESQRSREVRRENKILILDLEDKVKKGENNKDDKQNDSQIKNKPFAAAAKVADTGFSAAESTREAGGAFLN